MRSSLKLRTLVAATTVLAGAMPAVAQDPTQPVSAPEAVQTLSAGSDSEVLSFWTAERMKNAVSLDIAREATPSPFAFGLGGLSTTHGEAVLASSGLPGQAPAEPRCSGTCSVPASGSAPDAAS